MMEINLKGKELTNSEVYLQDYEQVVREESMSLKPLGLFLSRHRIDANLRGRMLDWMTEVTSSYRFEDKSYFDGVNYMDKYFKAKK